MKSSDRQTIQLKRPPNYILMVVAILAAIIMWYVVSVRDRIEAQVEVNIDYNGIPSSLVVTDGLVTKLQVRLRGPETLLRSMPRERLTEAIDLSKIKKGDTIVPLGGEGLGPAFRAFDVIDIQPSRIVIKADNLIEKSVPLRAEIDSPFGGGALTVENVTVSPGTAILKGPEEVLSKISSVTLPIRLDPKTAGARVTQTIPLDTPSLVTSNPASVRVSYTITSGRAVITRECPIKIAGNLEKNYTITPKTVSLMVEVPEALSRDSKYLDQLEVSVAPPPLEVGEKVAVKMRVRLPEGMTLLSQPTLEAQIRKNSEDTSTH